MDWALIESWKEMGVPLHIALRGIEKAFDSWESKPRKRSVKTLLYCQEEVEAQYAEWLEARVGAEVEDEPAGEAEDTSSDKLPFNRTAILEHLRHVRTQIAALVQTRSDSIEPVEALTRAVTQLSDLEREVEQSRQPEAQKLEVSLTGIERMLSDALRQSAPEEQQAELSAEIKKQLKPYRAHMEASVYEQTVNNLFLNRLREQLGIPRLSLFYLGL